MKRGTVFALAVLVLAASVLIYAASAAKRWADALSSDEPDAAVPDTTVIIEPTTVIEHTTYIDESEYAEPDMERTDEQIVIDIPADTVRLLARMLWGECRGVRSTEEKAACVWVVLNRVDAGYGCISDVVTAPGQFIGYRVSNPVDEDLAAVARDVLIRWYMEQAGLDSVGRVIPAEYLWFSADGSGLGNTFRSAYNGGAPWDWSLDNPYEEDEE